MKIQRKNVKLTFCESDELLKIVTLNKIYSNQENFDKLIRHMRRFTIAFKTHYLYDKITDFLKRNDIKHNKEYIKEKLRNFMKNCKHIVKTHDKYYIYVEKDYNTELQSLCRIQITYDINNSSEKRINKALVRRHIISQSEINRKSIELLDSEFIKSLRSKLRYYSFYTSYIDTNELSLMSREKKSIHRINRKKSHKIAKSRNYNTRQLIQKLDLT